MPLLLAIVFLCLGGLISGAAEPRAFVFCHFNLRNYAAAVPAGPERRVATKGKPEAEIEAVVEIVREINPDILGVCEMGSRVMLEDLQKRLHQAGLAYPETEFVEAFDRDRHLALLSRFPIVARNSARDVPFQFNGQIERVRRGFLDVTLEINPRYRLRAVGAHLKSKLPGPEDDGLLRRHEVRVLRKYLEQTMADDPQVNLLCYGDFNESKNEPVFQEMSGVRGTTTFLTDLEARDAVGDRWTHYWKPADQYSRIDYFFVNPPLLREVRKDQAQVYRGPQWQVASDHRAIFVSIFPENR